MLLKKKKCSEKESCKVLDQAYPLDYSLDLLEMSLACVHWEILSQIFSKGCIFYYPDLMAASQIAVGVPAL